MQRTASLVLAIAFLVTAPGCVTSRLVGHDQTISRKFTNDVGVTGNRTNLTIEAGSKIPKLSIIGDDCQVAVEDGAHIARIEFWGNGSTVTIPAGLMVYISQAGTNTVVHRTK
jgi:hypothetical protein